MRPIIIAFVALALALVSTSARADGEFHRLPGKDARLQIKVVEYDGSVNGELKVAVKNTGAKPLRFSASGLYFVPDGDADSAPQRLGAVGPMQIAEGEDTESRTAITIPAGQTIEVTLDVFCIDSHRSSPSSSTAFTVGAKRMPAALAKKIDKQTAKAAADAGGYAAPAAKDEIQSEVWKTRDAKWVHLDGEGAQEADK
jgi:hypothetical protein